MTTLRLIGKMDRFYVTALCTVITSLSTGCKSNGFQQIINPTNYQGKGLYVYIIDPREVEVKNRDELADRTVYIQLINCTGKRLLFEDLRNVESISLSTKSRSSDGEDNMSFLTSLRSQRRNYVLVDSIDSNLLAHNIRCQAKTDSKLRRQSLYQNTSLLLPALIPHDNLSQEVHIDEKLRFYDACNGGEFYFHLNFTTTIPVPVSEISSVIDKH
jgi:hypothetical protein